MDGTFNLFIYSYGISWGSMLTKYDQFLRPTLAQENDLTISLIIWPPSFCMNSVTYPKKHGSFINPLFGRESCNCHPVVPFKRAKISICLFLKKTPSSPYDLKSPGPRLCLTNLTHGTLVVDLLRIFGGYSPLASQENHGTSTKLRGEIRLKILKLTVCHWFFNGWKMNIS